MVTNTKDIETNYISTKLTNQEGPLYGNIKLVYIKRNRSTNDSSLGISSYNNSRNIIREDVSKVISNYYRIGLGTNRRIISI